MVSPMFTKGFENGFNKHVSEGDSITCTVDGFVCTAAVYRDPESSSPDSMQDGFWPLLDPKDAGYIGKGKGKKALAREMAKAKRIYKAWERGEWWYGGVAVTVSKAGVLLTPKKHYYSVWGIECNYPSSDNSYLLQVANSLLDDALEDAKAKVAALAPAGEQWHQGDIRELDGAVIAVVIAPEDVADVVRSSYGRTLTTDQARQYIAEHSKAIVDGFLQNWAEILAYVHGLDEFAEKHGKKVRKGR